MDILQEYRQDGIYLKHGVDAAPNDAAFPMHIHGTCEIYFFLAGKVEYLVEGTSYPLRPGSLLLMRPAESHKPKILASCCYERYNINFPLSLFANIDPEGRLMRPFLDRPLGRGNLYASAEFGDFPLQKMFHEMCYCEKDEYGKRLKILTRLLCMLDAVHKAYLKRGASEYMPPKCRSEEIVTYVNTNLLEDISVPMLAEHFFLSVSQFNRVFKAATGAAPWTYITVKRLTAAKEKIRGGASVQSAFECSGFGDYSTFYRAYTKHFGHAPTEDHII